MEMVGQLCVEINSDTTTDLRSVVFDPVNRPNGLRSQQPSGLQSAHFANPSNIFSASFSSSQNLASKSLAGVGGW